MSPCRRKAMSKIEWMQLILKDVRENKLYRMKERLLPKKKFRPPRNFSWWKCALTMGETRV